MTQLVQQLFEKVAALPREKQDSFASLFLAELEADNKWDQLFASSGSMLEKMARRGARST